MKMSTFRKMKRQLGQGMTEYIIIVALIAVAAIAGVTAFSDTVQGNFAAISEELSGTDSAASGKAEASAAAGEALNAAQSTQGMGNYAEDATH